MSIVILEKGLEKLREKPAIIRRNCKSLAVLGDTHGYLEISKWFVQKFRDLDCLFMLGDYVDRGPRGVENFEYVLKEASERDNLEILRGNHESILMNEWYGFKGEVIAKRGREYLRKVAEIYKELPLAGVVNDEIFLVHGGIPCRVCTEEPEEPVRIQELYDHLNEIKGTEIMDLPSDPIAFQMIWNDPDPGVEWFAPNIRGDGTYYYGVRAWTSFLDVNRLALIVRAHETVDGVLIYTSRAKTISPLRYSRPLTLENLRGSVITVFSSLYHGRKAAALAISGGLIYFYEYY